MTVRSFIQFSGVKVSIAGVGVSRVPRGTIRMVRSTVGASESLARTVTWPPSATVVVAGVTTT
jgi:hypothetical protein